MKFPPLAVIGSSPDVSHSTPDRKTRTGCKHAMPVYSNKEKRKKKD
jgi:hypothetical protein